MNRLGIVAGLGALALLGCGDVGGPDDVQAVSGDVGAIAAPPSAGSTIAFQSFHDEVGGQAAKESRALIRTARGYQDVFGHAPPATVDFSREWVMFYAAGTKPSGGYDASFVAVLRVGRNLVAITRLASPGPGCAVDAAITTPHALIKFPAQNGTSAQFYKQDTTGECGPNLCAAVTCPTGYVCDSATGKCAPGPEQCGPVCDIYCEHGNVLDAKGCPTCRCNPPPADACAAVLCGPGTYCQGGKCLPSVSCGGLAGKPCPGFGKCVDDPSDGCDPATGGADCGGICSCVQNVACDANSSFDSSPSVCACVPAKPPVCPPVCKNYCQFGNVPDANGCPTCTCNPDPCAMATCAAGTHCDAGKCVADGPSCGGIAGKACPGAGKCVDDPRDSCDPAKGGADCGGICSCEQSAVSCPADSKFDGSPSVCACVPAKPVCGPVCAIYCEHGNVLDANGCPTCQCNPPPADPCATVKCATGTHCDSGTCVSDGLCGPDECPAPAPGAPSMLCPDGTVAGPVCRRNADGKCGWAIISCVGATAAAP